MNEMATVKYRVTGLGPMLQHNSRLANPMNEYTKAIKKISSKRKKTEEDHEEMARLEYMGSLYHDKKMGVYIPAGHWMAGLVEGAKKSKLGKAFKSAITCFESTPLTFDGPKNPEQRWKAGGSFIDQRMAKVQQSRVLRTRPLFDNWSAIVEFQYDKTLVDKEQIDEAMTVFGSQVGLCDYRPMFGRFEVKK